LSDRNALERFLAGAAGRPVIGTETLAEKTLLSQPEARGAVLSLDFRGPNLVGPSDLMERPQLWPQDLILMSLHRVGSSTGPAMDLLARCRALAPHHRFYSAGGVRDLHDLATLQAAGAAGVLLASALHDGHITPREAAELR
jgi:phosphoribosylformimino-5-aminoimidazole carboxamide ribotide isomerase